MKQDGDIVICLVSCNSLIVNPEVYLSVTNQIGFPQIRVVKS